MKDNKENQNEFKKDLHEWLAEMNRRREINRKRDEEQAYWNQPLDTKDRDQKIMKNEEMELINENGTWTIKWNDGFKREFDSFFKAKLHFVALVNQQIAMERQKGGELI